MRTLLFLFFHIIKRLLFRIESVFYQYYNIEYLKWKGAKIGKNCNMDGKTAFSLPKNVNLEIGDNFICRSVFRSIYLVVSIHVLIYLNRGVKIGHHSGMSATNINCSESVVIGNYVMIGAVV